MPRYMRQSARRLTRSTTLRSTFSPLPFVNPRRAVNLTVQAPERTRFEWPFTFHHGAAMQPKDTIMQVSHGQQQLTTARDSQLKTPDRISHPHSFSSQKSCPNQNALRHALAPPWSRSSGESASLPGVGIMVSRYPGKYSAEHLHQQSTPFCKDRAGFWIDKSMCSQSLNEGFPTWNIVTGVNLCSLGLEEGVEKPTANNVRNMELFRRVLISKRSHKFVRIDTLRF